MTYQSTHQSPETPSQADLHAVPAEAVVLLQAIWTRIKMAGKECARATNNARRLGLATTLLTAVTSLGVFTTLQSEPSFPARAAAGAVLALAAVLSAWQTWVGKGIEVETPALHEMLRDLEPIKRELLHSLSNCQLFGTPVSDDLLASANQALDTHMQTRPGEYPSFEVAERAVIQELVQLGLPSGDTSQHASA